MRRYLLPFISVVVLTLAFLAALTGPRISVQAGANQAGATTFVGFDRNVYPGDDAVPVLRKTFSFAGYWLSPPPGERVNTWRGKRELLRSQGFGFVLLYRGRESKELKTPAQAKLEGIVDARDAAAAAKAEGFAIQTVVFLDIEEGGRLPTIYHAYLSAWAGELSRLNYRVGVYCSAIPVSEGGGSTITTADDIRNNIGAHDVAYWVFNDVCPPSPGCGAPQNPPPVSASGASYAAVWQFAQSPRREERTARCAATYHSDGNCYAPGDTTHAWFLDVNSASSADPSGGDK
jgi:hypothetical protein